MCIRKTEHMPVDILNIIDISLRRFVRVAKRLSTFLRLEKLSQSYLLRGAILCAHFQAPNSIPRSRWPLRYVDGARPQSLRRENRVVQRDDCERNCANTHKLFQSSRARICAKGQILPVSESGERNADCKRVFVADSPIRRLRKSNRIRWFKISLFFFSCFVITINCRAPIESLQPKATSIIIRFCGGKPENCGNWRLHAFFFIAVIAK